MHPADPRPNRDGAGPPESESEQALRWVQRARAENELVALIAQRVHRRRQRRISVLAVTCVALAAVGFTWRTPEQMPADARVAQVESAATAIVTSPRREVLPDGSVVEFKDGAEIVRKFSENLRRVTLVRGEAHFQVAKDTSRPFIVSVQGVEVRAVGTAFSVQLGVAAVEVLVTEGRVAVGPSSGPVVRTHSVEAIAPDRSATGEAGLVQPEWTPSEATVSAVLDAGHRAWIRLGEAAPEVTPLASEEIVRRLSWRVPQLEFSRTRLAEIVTLMNRHSSRRGSLPIVIDEASTALSEVKLSGYLAADNTEGLVRLLETNFRVRAEVTPEAIRLHRGP